MRKTIPMDAGAEADSGPNFSKFGSDPAFGIVSTIGGRYVTNGMCSHCMTTYCDCAFRDGMDG